MKTEINGKPAELLFYNNWMYNIVRIQNKLKSIFEYGTGSEVSIDRYQTPISIPSIPTYVVNRTLQEQIEELTEKVNYIESRPIKCTDSYLEYKHKLGRYQQIPNDPILKTGATSFVMNGVFYSVLFDDNMFFDTHYAVAPVIGEGKNQTVNFAYYRKFFTDWKFDSLYRCDCSQDDINEAAWMIANKLLQSEYQKERGQSFYVHYRKGSDLK